MPLRIPVLVSPVACLLGVMLPGVGWTEQPERLPPVAEGARSGRLKPGQIARGLHAPSQSRPPRSPAQFNPDPGARGTTPAVPAPAPGPRITPPDLPPPPNPAAPPPKPALPTGSPLDLGFPGSTTGSPL